MKKPPKRIDLDLEQVDALLKRVEAATLQDGDYEIIKAMVETIHLLSNAVDEKAASIRRLLRMLFGDKTEKLKNVLDQQSESSDKRQPEDKTTSENDKPKGHGRNAAAEYSGAEKVNVPHQDLKPGDPCPVCPKGKVYELKEPEVVVRITGKAPLSGTVYYMQRLRCNACGEIFKAVPPDKIGDEKYDAQSGAMIALLKYGSGMPFNRLEGLQASLGVPLPASTQWEIVEQIADRIYPAHLELNFQGAQGDVVYNDDTTAKILELMKKNKKEDAPERKGMFTTGIMSTSGDRQIALFYTGRKHAGENMDDLLRQRQTYLAKPIQMCDGLSRNVPKRFKTILLNCLSHGRRNFVDVAPSFPEECQHILEALAKIYKNDEIAKERKMTPGQRLSFHQVKSSSIMKELKTWLEEQLDQHKVEPNSGLGQAISYMIKHWKELTGFLRIKNAPLDNNLCERALKKAILHRKNSLFYKTQHGADVGDLFMSLIHTCNLGGVNPFEYLVALQEHASELAEHPENWMPWNYESQLSSFTD
jgi:transposase